MPFEQKLNLEAAFRANIIPFEHDSLVIRMANGEYKSPHFENKNDKITVKVEIHDDTSFVVRYSPYPEKEVLEELAEKVYLTIRDSKDRLIASIWCGSICELFPTVFEPF